MSGGDHRHVCKSPLPAEPHRTCLFAWSPGFIGGRSVHTPAQHRPRFRTPRWFEGVQHTPACPQDICDAANPSVSISECEHYPNPTFRTPAQGHPGRGPQGQPSWAANTFSHHLHPSGRSSGFWFNDRLGDRRSVPRSPLLPPVFL